MTGGGSQKQQSQTTTSAPWSAQQPYLMDLFSEAQNLKNKSDLSYYSGKLTADPSQATTNAENMISQRATSGSPLNTQAQGLLSNTLAGNYLNNNPYLDATFNQAAKNVTANVNSSFGGAGRYGSGLNQTALATGLSSLANDIYGGNYQAERSRQNAAMQLAPTLANQDYYDLAQLQTVGSNQDTRSQDAINAEIQRYNYNQEAPWQELALYQGLINGNYGGTSTTSSPIYRNKGAGILGGAASGAALGSSFGPWGTAIGAVGGGLLGGMQ